MVNFVGNWYISLMRTRELPNEHTFDHTRMGEMMNIQTVSRDVARRALVAVSPRLARAYDDHREGILERFVDLFVGLARGKARLVIDNEGTGAWTTAQISQAIRRCYGTDYSDDHGDMRMDRVTGLVVPNGATIAIGSGSYKQYLTSVPAGSKPAAARGRAFRTGVVQGTLRKALDHLTAEDKAGRMVAATVPGAGFASTFVPHANVVGQDVVIVTAYRLQQ